MASAISPIGKACFCSPRRHESFFLLGALSYIYICHISYIIPSGDYAKTILKGFVTLGTPAGEPHTSINISYFYNMDDDNLCLCGVFGCWIKLILGFSICVMCYKISNLFQRKKEDRMKGNDKVNEF